MHILKLAPALALVVAATAATAQPAPSTANRPGFAMGAAVMFELADRDRDGRVSLGEAWAFLEATFSAADADRSRALSLEELAVFAGGAGRDRRPANAASLEAVFRGLDADRDRAVQLEELRPALEAAFRSADRNYDNVLTRDELPGPPR